MRFADHLTQIADVLHSTAEGGEVRVNVGEDTTGEGERADVQVWGGDGFLARPNDPSDKGTCQALYVIDGQQQRVVAFRDNRFAAQAGTMDPGDRLVVTKGPPRVYIKQKRQRVGLYTESTNSPPAGGKSMVVDLDGEGNVLQVKYGGCSLVADGQKWTITASNGATNASIVIDPAKGITITAGAIYLDGGTVTLGLTGGTVRPSIPAVNSVLYGAIGQSGIGSATVFVAT